MFFFNSILGYAAGMRHNTFRCLSSLVLPGVDWIGYLFGSKSVTPEAHVVEEHRGTRHSEVVQ